MEGTSSVSKGIFVFKKPQNLSGKKKGSRIPEIANIKEPWYLAYKTAWQNLEEQVKELFKEIFAKLLTDVSTYLHAQQENSQSNSTFAEIPTAVILTGINLPDHNVLFSSLSNRLKADVSPHVVTLSSRSCGKVRTMVGNILQQCQQATDQNEQSMNQDSEMEDEELEHTEKCHRVAPCTFSELVEWYSNQHDQNQTPIIVIITDFEGFQSQVLEDFIYIASEYREQLPLCLVFGVATTISAVHSILTHRVILSPKCPFKVGGSLLRMLSDIFIFYDFSIHCYLQRFQFCMLTHYGKRKIALSSWSTKNVATWISRLESKELDEIRKLQSFRTYIETQSGQDKKNLIFNPKFFKEKTVELIQNFLQHFSLFLVGLKCLNELARDLPGQPLGKYLGNLYTLAVSSPIGMTSEYRECDNIWRNLSKTGLEIHLRNMIQILKEIDCKILDSWVTKLKAEVKRLHDLESKANKCPSPSKSNKVQELKTLKSRAQLSEQLKEIAHTAPELNQFERLRSEILSVLALMLGGGEKSLLRPLVRLPLHELVLFEESTSVVREELIGSSRSTLHNALANPHTYLK
ncbi:hypothetical protein B566_EDAN013821, partial [Ephemera danica]